MVPLDEATDESHTFIHDLATNTAQRLPDADLFSLGMNYMTVYDEAHGVFILVTGSFHRDIFLERTKIWAFRLDRALLE